MSGITNSAEGGEDNPSNKKERPESQPSIDPLSLHIIRRVSHRVKPGDSFHPPEIQVTKSSDNADDQDHQEPSPFNENSNVPHTKEGYVQW